MSLDTNHGADDTLPLLSPGPGPALGCSSSRSFPRCPSRGRRRSYSVDDGEELASAGEPGVARSEKPTPLPLRPLLVICLTRAAEATCSNLIFPFLNQMIEDLGIASDNKHVGYYAGLIQSAFALAQFATAFFWGRLSDSIGHKPVIIFGLLGMALSTLAFGLQTSLAGLIVTRALTGIADGHVAVLMSYIAHITDDTNRARAISLFMIAYPAGGAVGPAIGGFLAPAQVSQLSEGEVEGSYLPPCAVAAAVALAALVLCIFTLDQGAHPEPSIGEDAASESEEATKTQRSSYRRSPISALTVPLIWLILLGMAFWWNDSGWKVGLVPLVSTTRLKDGGLGLTPSLLGSALTSYNILIALVRVGLFPTLQHRLGSRRVYALALFTLPFTWILLPIWTSWSAAAGFTPIVRAIGLILIQAVRSATALASPCQVLMISELSPDSSALGTLYGFLQMGELFAEAVGPVSVASLFAYSINQKAFGGSLVYLIATGVSLLTLGLALISPIRPPRRSCLQGAPH